MAFSVGSYAVRLPVGFFIADSDGYEYQKTTNGISLSIDIDITSTPGSYVLRADRSGGTLTSTTSPVPVTLTIGDNSGTTNMNALTINGSGDAGRRHFALPACVAPVGFFVGKGFLVALIWFIFQTIVEI